MVNQTHAPLENDQDESHHDSNPSTSPPGDFDQNSVPTLLYPQSEQIPLWSLSVSLNSRWWSANNPTFSTSCPVHLPSHLLEIQLSLENKASLGSLPRKSYALSQISCCGGLVVLPISHRHILSVAHLPSYKAPVLWGCVIWLYHFAPGSEPSFLSTRTLFIIFSNVNIPMEDLLDALGHSNSWPPYFSDLTYFSPPISWSHHGWTLLSLKTAQLWHPKFKYFTL